MTDTSDHARCPGCNSKCRVKLRHVTCTNYLCSYQSPSVELWNDATMTAFERVQATQQAAWRMHNSVARPRQLLDSIFHQPSTPDIAWGSINGFDETESTT